MKYFVILFLLFGSIIYSQDSEIKGRIINSSTQQPLESANIFVQGKTINTISDSKGQFILKGNLDQNDVIEISYIGFEKKKIPVKSLSKNLTNDISLESELITSQTVLVNGTIAKSGETPISFSKIDRKSIAETYTDQDVPEILSYTPSATFYSENGNGLGYNYLSIRGFDQKRISVAVNGIPQNEPEDHNVYWIDFPDVLEGTELVQVQRGAGAGIAGFAAIGGSINILTSSFSEKQKVELSSSLGSYNTRKYSASVSTGLIDGKYSIYAKLSQTLSSGYRNSSWVDMKSYHLSVVRYDEKFTSQINIFGGPIGDGLAYTGLPKFAVKDKNLRKANYNYWEASENGYTYTQERRPQEVEKFFQPHFELMNEYRFNENVKINSALFLIIGNGYFDYDGSWADTSYFRLTKENGFNATENPANTIIRAKVENVQWGWIPRVSFKHDNGELILGGEMRFHNSNHWGSLNYAENLPKEWTKDFKYYYYEGANSILNFYAHENFNIGERFNILAEAQFAYHNYKIQNERYLGNNFSIDNLFFNPRLGINYKATSELSFFFSFAQVSREPRLKNYYDAAESSGGEAPQFETNADGSYNYSKPFVQPETMNDFEAGISFNKGNTFASLNLFYMLFNDEIVKQGQLDRFGQPITGNMERTLHYGIEAELNSRIIDGFDLVLNGSLSKNKIDKGFAYFTDDLTQYKFDLSGNQISGFPNYIFNAILKFNYENLLVQLAGKYVGSFYSDNYDSKLGQYLKTYSGITDYTDNKVDAYFTANLFASYNLEINSLIKNLNIFIQANNLFDNLYAANAIGKEFFPAAERNVLFGLKMSL